MTDCLVTDCAARCRASSSLAPLGGARENSLGGARENTSGYAPLALTRALLSRSFSLSLVLPLSLSLVLSLSLSLSLVLSLVLSLARSLSLSLVLSVSLSLSLSHTLSFTLYVRHEVPCGVRCHTLTVPEGGAGVSIARARGGAVSYQRGTPVLAMVTHA